MGKHVERALGETNLNTKNLKQEPIKLEKFKAFKELADRVNNIEFVLKDLTDKLVNFEVGQTDNVKPKEEK